MAPHGVRPRRARIHGLPHMDCAGQTSSRSRYSRAQEPSRACRSLRSTLSRPFPGSRREPRHRDRHASLLPHRLKGDLDEEGFVAGPGANLAVWVERVEPLDRSLGLSRCKPEARLQSIIWGLGIPRGSVTANWCRYCIRIREHDPEYRTRRATHVRESTFPRCDFHWRFVCDECGQSRIFHGVAYCPRRDALVCVECSPEQRAVRRRFWGWSYYFSLRCPWHAGFHPALDRLEYEGRHPWQLRSSDFRARRRRGRSGKVPERWTSHVGPRNRGSDAADRKGWGDISRWWGQR